MLWILIAFLGPIQHALANILDNYFVNKIFKHPAILVFYSSLINILFIPLILIFKRPHLPTLKLIPLYFILGAIEIAYLYPYYKALQDDDTSIVTSLFDLGKIFVPILAFFIVKERLSLIQYLGFIVLILGSTLLTIHHSKKKFKFTKALPYMMLVSFILAFESVIYKYIFETTDWATGFIWPMVTSFLIIIPILLFRKYRKMIKSHYKDFKTKIHLFVIEELLTFGGSAASTFAISLAPVTLVESIDSFQPFFVLIYAILFSKIFPKYFKEKIDISTIGKKIILFTVMIIGVILVSVL